MESFKPLYDGPFLNEFALRYEGEMDLADLRQALGYQGYLAGVVAEGLENVVIFAATEQRTKEEIDQFVASIREFVD